MAVRRTAVRRNISSTSGMVLVIALIALAVMMILLLALFQGASHQLRSGQADAALAREKMLADSAVALVIGQIEQASTQPHQAWISQPGLLRTYSTNAVRTPTACYKLYSTASLSGMTDTSGNLNFFATDVPSNWSSEPSQYTDLNAPSQTPGLFGQSLYPILDPAATNNVTVIGVSSDTGAVTMPVAWLYQLQDGTLGPASNGTAANPIVARIAFWTDDETCKINVNTAGCGSPWNTPRVNSTNDVAWSTNQPAQGEYSSYPGHPATTLLGMALGTNAHTPQELLGLTPRYAWGGAEFETQPTAPGEIVPTKMDRLYASLDELCFSTNLTGSPLQRQANPVTAAQLETARFVLTAHSNAPETTLLGEPRVAIWPVADSTSSTAPQITATDVAITNAATVGAGTSSIRDYFFQRNNPLNPKDDFDPTATSPSLATTSNLQLFNDLVNRGNLILPGYGTSLGAKYSGAAWTQIMLEITDFIHGINAVDPSPAPFVPFAAGNSTGVGRAFVDPLTTTYGTGASQITLRGLGRCPTLSSLTLVFYVSGFGFKNGSYIDYEETPDNSSGSNWKSNFLPASTNWANVANERVRAFVVPSTFQPGCAYPEVSDPCTIEITGLDAFNLKNGTTSGSFGFTSPLTSSSLSDAVQVTPSDRAWGGDEGSLAWRAAAVNAQTNTGTFTYPLAGTKAFPITLASSPSYNSGVLTWPAAKVNSMVLASTVPVTVLILDANGNTLQSLTLNFQSTGFPVPNPVAEYTRDGSGNAVEPSYYMTLKNRVLLTATNREFLVQPGDVSRSVEAITDLRVIAGLTNVPSSMFKGHPFYTSIGSQHAHNLYFPDGTAVYGAAGTNSVFASGSHPVPTSTSVIWTNWCNNAQTNYAWPVSPPCNIPTTNNGVYMASGVAGDWDTGPGFSPDGAQINLPDAGTTNAPSTAYFSLTGGSVGAPTQRTPNALVASPVIFGSLPVGINPTTPASSQPWRTLLFCPYPAGDTVHPGFGNPTSTPPIAPDHLVLDNFWMPVVEPYAISTCMATAGKINLNDQIAPFIYLHRNTALHALLNALRIPAIPLSAASTYKSAGTPSTYTFWNPVDENETIAEIENKFANNSVDAYLSESEICTVPLVPQGLVAPGTSVAATQTALDSFWNGFSAAGGLTGDNLRELPYAQLYGRLTARSNSYTVHVRVQVLQKLPHDPNQNVWNEGSDLVLGDWRGSYEIERYLDPAATAPAAGSQLGPYKFRIVSSRRFAP